MFDEEFFKGDKGKEVCILCDTPWPKIAARKKILARFKSPKLGQSTKAKRQKVNFTFTAPEPTGQLRALPPTSFLKHQPHRVAMIQNVVL
jgi:hypothetical protein